MHMRVTTATLLIGLIVVAHSHTAKAEERQWTDSTGEFTVMAEFVGIEHGNVVLKKADGQELVVPVRKLSSRDRDFVRSQRSSRDNDPKVDGPAQVAEAFYNELRVEEREAVKEMLTPKAKEEIEKAKDKSPLAGLPTPDEGNRSVRVGRPSIDGKVAEVPVQVRAGGTTHKTKVHLRNEENEWLVFALSAVYPNGETSMNFEAAPPKEGGDRLEALVGQPFALTGVTLDGRQVDISQYQGRPVLVDFWATWCGPCREEMKNIAQNYQKFRNQGFDVIAVSVDQDLESLAEFVSKAKLPWAVLADNLVGGQNSMAARYGISSLPALILVGPDGKVAAVNCRGEALGQELTKLLAASDQRTSSLPANQQQP